MGAARRSISEVESLGRSSKRGSGGLGFMSEGCIKIDGREAFYAMRSSRRGGHSETRNSVDILYIL